MIRRRKRWIKSLKSDLEEMDKVEMFCIRVFSTHWRETNRVIGK